MAYRTIWRRCTPPIHCYGARFIRYGVITVQRNLCETCAVINVHQHSQHKHLVNETNSGGNDLMKPLVQRPLTNDTNGLNRILVKKIDITTLLQKNYNCLYLWIGPIFTSSSLDKLISPLIMWQRNGLGVDKKSSGHLCQECRLTLITDAFRAKIEADNNYTQAAQSITLLICWYW